MLHDKNGKGKGKGKDGKTGGSGNAGGANQGGTPSKAKGDGKSGTNKNQTGGGRTSRSVSADARKKLPCFANLEGKCKHKDNPEKCSFAHRDPVGDELKQFEEYKARRATSPAPSTTNDAEVCPAWLKGDCPLGKKCKNKHPQKLKGRDKG